jgi:hypothetical protein
MTMSPTRFQKLDRPTPKEFMGFERSFMKGICRPSPQQAETLRQSLWVQDHLADQWTEFAHENLNRNAAKRWVDLALSQGIDRVYQAPEPLVQLFNQVETVPLWLDKDLLALARQTVRRSGPLGNWLLVNVALMGGYRYEGVIQPLLITGKLTEYAPKRLSDTTQFVQDVLSDKGFEHGKKGISSVIRVRLLHAHIRFHLKHHPQWSNEEWGAPINQADMVGTLLLFSLSFLVTSRVMGLNFSAREAQSVIHLWRYVGYLLGIQEHLIPATEEEARRMFYLIGMTQTLAGAEAAELGRALHEVPLKKAEGLFDKLNASFSMKLRSGISQLFLGDEAMKHLGVPTTRVRYALVGTVPLIFTLDRARARLPGMTKLATKIGGYWQDKHAEKLLM